MRTSQFDIILPAEDRFPERGRGLSGGPVPPQWVKVYSCEYSGVKKEAPGAFLWDNCSQVLGDPTNRETPSFVEEAAHET